MWNMPGCLPEIEPCEFDTFEQARDCIVDALEALADDYLVEALATDEMTDADKRTVAARRGATFASGQHGPFAVNAENGYVYTVERTDWDWSAFRIGAYFASYLINGDASGIEESEVRTLDEFITRTQDGRTGGHWTVDAKYGEEFARCEVTGTMGECINVRYCYKG
jgi:hypothetical protein